ncbi:GNAT family N-acetyltransferase [Streptomyces sp. NPDC090442]|uniref:GNAT family N-acetyltransferase n=1 Tax=Streptomyces sp. NPDC090442 TaxID=3365962 RepID=UPI0037F5291D
MKAVPLLVRGEVVIGMAWLAITQRVPHPRAFERMSGDVQCVYVTPGERDHGLGGVLIKEVVDWASELASFASSDSDCARVGAEGRLGVGPASARDRATG